MGKILYLSTKLPEIDALDSKIRQLKEKLADPRDLKVTIIREPIDLSEITINNYALIVFDSDIAISPWNIIKEIKASLGANSCPAFWVEGDVNAITKNYLEANQLTGTILITKGSKTVISTCNGHIDGQLASDAPLIEIHTPHNICSIGKILTGLTTLQLIQKGKLQLTDRIYNYLPDNFPDRHKFESVTVEHLLRHTAGMGNYTDKYNIALNDVNQEAPQFKSLEDFVTFIENPASLEVGVHKYSNVGYAVLGKVIEEAANQNKAANEHQDYWDVVNELILAPNHITITRDKPLSEHPATNSQFPTTIKTASSPAGANMWATPEELTKLAHVIMKRINEEPDFKERLDNLNLRMFPNEELYYSAGIMTGLNSQGKPFYYHDGAAPGISSYLRIDPSTQTTETIFINNDKKDEWPLAGGMVASNLKSYIMDAEANHIYYADLNFTDEPKKRFEQVAQEAGVNVLPTPLIDREITQRYKEATAKTRHSEQPSIKVEELDETNKGTRTPFKTSLKCPDG